MQLDWKWLRKHGDVATPLFVHVLMVVGVTVYAIVGALIMQKIESSVPVTTTTTSLLFRRDLSRRPMGFEYTDRQHSEINATRNATVIRPVRDAPLATVVVRNRKCVIAALKEVSARGGCSNEALERANLRALDKCYQIGNASAANPIDPESSVSEIDDDVAQPWSFMDSLLFSFTVITTIGYGNVAPRTFGGRFFCILYGLFGIPFTLLVIADLGKFLSEVMVDSSKKAEKFIRFFRNKIFGRRKVSSTSGEECMLTDRTGTDVSNGSVRLKESLIMEQNVDLENGNVKVSSNGNNEIVEDADGDEDDEKSVESEPADGSSAAISLLILFFIYIIGGALMLSSYEPDMDFFKAIYFNFVTLTSIGLGDIVPKSETFMACTIVYIAVGLALTTIAIEIAADTLKKLHYFGRKIENVASVAIWFGGKKLTMRQLVKNLGDQFNLPIHTIKNLDLDHFVDQAIKVEEGVIETLRPPPVGPEDMHLEATTVDFADEEDDNVPVPPPPPRQSLFLDAIPMPEPEIAPPPPVPEPEPIEEIDEAEEEEEQLIVIDPVPQPPPPPPKKLTAAELAAQKRKAYSEEAWKRYQEYQKQWKRFRQTKTAKLPKRKISRSLHGDDDQQVLDSPSSTGDAEKNAELLATIGSSSARSHLSDDIQPM